MALISESIPNLIQGISQQPDSLRLPTQAQAMENCYPSVVEGLMGRLPTEHIAKIITGAVGNCFTHVINRDTEERYVVIITNGAVRVYDINGNQKTVATPDGLTYLSSASPSTQFRAITVADYTFILNQSINTAMLPATSANRGEEGLIFVKKGEYGSEYAVFVDGVKRATYTTSTTDVLTLSTSTIAADLAADLAANLGAGWTITRSAHVIHIKKNDGTTFDLKTEDAQGGASMQCFKKKAQRFNLLPTRAPQGFHLEINADPENEADTYYVKFTCNNPAATFDEGTWQETVQQGIEYQLDATKMPHILVREASGDFTFKKATWNNRTSGDVDSNPDPTFVGGGINDIFFFKNRLGFLADENAIMSEVGEYFNFFRMTVTTLLDSDPIDVAASHTKVSILRHAVTFDKKCLMFSDQTQFIMEGSPFTMQTAEVDKSTEFESNLLAKPVGVGRTVYFITNKEGYNGLREYFVADNNSDQNDAVDVSAHIPKYIPTGAFKLAASTVESVLCLATTGDPDALYTYKFHWEGDKKAQSAWCRWTFGTGVTVLGMEFIETTLYILLQRSDGVYLEKLSVAPGKSDPHVSYITHLDRRITNAQCTSVTYDASLDQTTFNLPYTVDDPMQVVTRQTSPAAALAPGRALQIVSQTGAAIVTRGNFSTSPVWIGQIYNCSYTFSKFYQRKESRGGGVSIVAAGRLQIRTLSLIYSSTGYFKVTVTQAHRTPSEYVFTGRLVGDGNNIINEVALPSGKKRVLIMSKNDAVTITLSSDSFLPFKIMSAEWEAFFTARTQ